MTGRPANALKEFARVTSSTAEDRLKGQALFQAAQVLLEQGDRGGGTGPVSNVASLDTDRTLVEQSYVQRIRLLTQQQQFTLAKTLIQAFRSRFPTSELTPEVTRLAGEVSLQDHDFGDAIRSYRELADTHSDRNSSGSPDRSDRNVVPIGPCLLSSGAVCGGPRRVWIMFQRRGFLAGVQARVEYARGSISGNCSGRMKP